MKAGFTVLLVLLAGGCANVIVHTESHNGITPYSGTYDCAKLLALPFKGDGGGEDAIASAYATLLFPVFLADLPLEIAMDTVTLPYDCCTLAFAR